MRVLNKKPSINKMKRPSLPYINLVEEDEEIQLKEPSMSEIYQTLEQSLAKQENTGRVYQDLPTAEIDALVKIHQKQVERSIEKSIKQRLKDKSPERHTT